MVHMIALAAIVPLLAQAPPVSVSASRSGAATVVAVAIAQGARVSEPKLLAEPWRLYFDITGVSPGDQRVLEVGSQTGGPVSRVRLALNQPAAPITRVVIDMPERAAWRMERAADGTQVRVIVGAESGGSAGGPQTEAPDLRQARAEKELMGRVLYAAAPEPAVDRRAQIRAKLFAMAGALEAMRTWTGPSDAQLAALLGDVGVLATGARAMTVSGSAADLALVAAIDAVAAAARARAQALADGTPQSRANAISAAAGALLLLDHAREM